MDNYVIKSASTNISSNNLWSNLGVPYMLYGVILRGGGAATNIQLCDGNGGPVMYLNSVAANGKATDLLNAPLKFANGVNITVEFTTSGNVVLLTGS